MKKVLALFAAMGLLLVPLAVDGQSGQTAANAPPVGQVLVPEGDFALKLVSALKLGASTTEAEAEDSLMKVGIAPKNGWIADYPVTPIILGQLQEAIVSAADSKRVPMGKEEALKGYQDLTAKFGLGAIAEVSGQYAGNEPQSGGDASDSPAVNNYYNDEGPPVVTYYPPPPDYGYLYTWAPYPFWRIGFFFPGFFVLNDFDIVVAVDHHGHHHHHAITNHFIDPKTHAVVRVDPTTRTLGRRVGSSPAESRGFRSAEARRGASSISNRSLERVKTAKAVNGTTGKRGEATVRGSAAGQPAHRATHSEAFSAPPSGALNRGSEGSGRSFTPPSRSNTPPMGGGSSFGGFHGGGFRR